MQKDFKNVQPSISVSAKKENDSKVQSVGKLTQ